MAHDTPAQDEPQQEEVAHRNDDERNQKPQQDFLHLIKSKQHLRVPLFRIRFGKAHQAQLVIRRHLQHKAVLTVAETDIKMSVVTNKHR